MDRAGMLGGSRAVNVLIMTESWQAALACIHSLGRQGHMVTCCVASSVSPNASSKYVANRIPELAPDESPGKRARALKRAVAEHKFDLVIPISDDDALAVATAHELYPEVRAFVAPPLPSVKVAGDKIETFKLAQQLGIIVPESIVAADAAQVEAAVAKLGLPAVLKLPVSGASAGVAVVKTMDEMRRALSRFPAGPMLVQKFIKGDFVGITGFAANGTLIDSFSFRSLLQPNGTPAYAVTFNEPRLHETARRLCAELNWSGGVDLDLLRDDSGTLFLLEMNPRFSGTLVFADKLGVDLPKLYVDFVLGSDLVPVPPRPSLRETLFISVVPTEAALISQQPPSGQQKAALLREQYKYVENLYNDDGPLLAAQLRQALFIAWNSPRI